MVDEVAFLRWIPLLPLASAVAIGLLVAVVRRPPSPTATAALACGSVLASFALCCHGLVRLLALEPGPGGETRMLLDVWASWMGVGIGDAAFSADIALQYDALSCVMALLVTGIGLLIHVYSVGYMSDDTRDDRGFQRYFAYLNLFVAAMLVLVLGDNLLMLFLGWEGVGLCSYLLIGFWFGEDANARAGTKAFIVNRVGDFGFLIGTFLLFWALSGVGEPTVAFREIEAGFPRIADERVAWPNWLIAVWAFVGLGSSGAAGTLDLAFPSVIAFCFFVAACGKSAQFPLHVWLPDAMAGPTPVSALIHAATMVTAGIYLVCRMHFLFEAAPETNVLIAWTGAITALFAAAAAIAQSDIKKVLAWSTVSQLGFMFVAAGCGAYAIAFFHLLTHAFFKATLFLGAGSVILACGHEQRMKKMGGLHGRLPVTHYQVLAGVLALSGFPLLSGFLSKEGVLVSAFLAHEIPGHLWLYWMGVVTATLTSFYAFRFYFMIFWGNVRLDLVRQGRLRDPSRWMSGPIWFVAVMAILGGAVGLPQIWGDFLFDLEGSDSLGRFLSEVLGSAPAHGIERSEEWALVRHSLLAFLIGFGLALRLYGLRDPNAKEKWARYLGWPYRALANQYWIDSLYDRILVRPLLFVSERVLYRGVDVALIDRAAVHGTAAGVRTIADSLLRRVHAGWMQSYALTVTLGLALVLYWLVGR